MADVGVLDAEEQRVLGALLEKERTVPATYPLSLSALRSATNQTSSRDPVVDYDDAALEAILKRLRARELVRVVWSDTGRRTLKYHQVLAERLELADDERALVTVLLLRGPQAPGELLSRTERLHGYADRGAVEGVLARLAARPEPLVVELERRPGQKDRRWAHLLGPDPAEEAAAVAGLGPAPAADREVVLAEGGERRDDRVRAAYDTVAVAYADALADELTDELTGELSDGRTGGLAFEAWLLRRVAADAGADPVVEVGCGPGHVTAFLAGAGAAATGIDLVPAMVAEARRRFPDGTYEVGDLRRLMRPTTSAGWGAVLAWYSLIHLAPSELPAAVAALARPLRPGGTLVVALHAGSRVRHVDAWFDHEVELDLVLHEPAEVLAALGGAGLVEVEWFLHGPHEWRGETTQRLYVVGRAPTSVAP